MVEKRKKKEIVSKKKKGHGAELLGEPVFLVHKSIDDLGEGNRAHNTPVVVHNPSTANLTL